MPSNHDFEFAQSVRGIVQRIAYQLGDAEPGDEYSGYDEQWITARVQDTFKWLQGRRPNLFAREISFDLSPGDIQTVPKECDNLLEVLTVTRDGMSFPVYMVDYEASQAARVYEKLLSGCNPITYDVALSGLDERSFRISPPVSPAKPVQVTANCSDMNRYFVDPDEPITCEVAKWINTVVEFVLYQALHMDSDSPGSQALANTHRATFFDLAPIQRRQETND